MNFDKRYPKYMRKLATIGLALGILLAATGCVATDPNASDSPSETQVLPSIDPSLIPTAAPASVIDVPADGFKTAYGDFIFKIGQGPTWCTISPDFGYTVCEQSEVATQYAPIQVPLTCQYSYGYQVRLWGKKPAKGPAAEFPCNGGAFSDPANAGTLLDGQRIVADGFSCFVSGVTARCDNQDGAYIVLGPQAWAIGN